MSFQRGKAIVFVGGLVLLNLVALLVLSSLNLWLLLPKSINKAVAAVAAVDSPFEEPWHPIKGHNISLGLNNGLQFTVDLSSDEEHGESYLVVGNPGFIVNSTQNSPSKIGKIWVYRRKHRTWLQRAAVNPENVFSAWTLVGETGIHSPFPSKERVTDNFGVSVSVAAKNGFVAVGSIYRLGDLNQVERVQVYKHSHRTGNWTSVGQVIEGLGSKVSLAATGNRLVVAGKGLAIFEYNAASDHWEPLSLNLGTDASSVENPI